MARDATSMDSVDELAATARTRKPRSNRNRYEVCRFATADVLPHFAASYLRNHHFTAVVVGGCVAGDHATLWQVGTVEAALENLKSEMAAAGLSSDARLVVTAKRSRTDHLVS